MSEEMDYKVELVAQAFYEADQDARLWDNEPAVIKGQFRLLNQDIGVLLLALEQSSAEERVEDVRLAA